MNIRIHHMRLWIALCALTLLFAPTLHAQVIIDPPPLPIPIERAAEWPVAVELHSINAQVEGPLADVTVKQVFRNDSSSTVESTYLFPLPQDVAPGSLQLTVDGQVIEGKLYDKDEARTIYEGIVRQQRDPALLEYIGNGLFQISVFPIPAGERRTVELTYEQALGQENGLYLLEMPLRVATPGVAPAEAVAVNVDLIDQPGLRAIYSPNYDIDIRRDGDDSAQVSFETSDAQIHSDFSLYFGTDESAIGANLLSYKLAGEDGYFMLLVAPSLEDSEQEIIERDVVLVLDISGSMQGEKIEQAREAVRYVVEQLNPGDRFNLITFSTGVNLWQRQPQTVSARTIRDANRWIDRIRASGSTDIHRALLEGLAQLDGSADERADDRPGYLLFMTDGLPTQGETDPQRIVENALDNRPAERSVRLFTFGVGYDVNTDLLGELSRQMGGRSVYVQPEEPIDEVVGDFYAQIGKPVLANVTVDFGDEMLVDDQYPYPLPDLFAGEQLVVTGRYRVGGPVKVTLSGEVNGAATTFIYPGQQLVKAGGDSFVARLWATRKIGALLDQIRRDGPNPELIDAIKQLSLEYGIVTPYTSYLVVEPGAGEAMAPAASVDIVPLSQSADATISARVNSMAQMAPSGAEAVVAAEGRAELAQASTVTERAEVRFIEGKTFARQGYVAGADGQALELWVDAAYQEGMTTETVRFASDRYFDLAQDARVARWLALSPEMIIVLGDGSALRVTTAE